MDDKTEKQKLDEIIEWRNITNKALAEISHYLIESRSVEEVSDIILKYALSVTKSRFGFVGYIDEKTGYLVAPTLTKGIWDECRVKDKNFIFKKFGGLWGWVLKNKKPLLTNSPREDERSSGIPEGHIKIDNFLSVPAVIKDKLLGQIALADSPLGYTELELMFLERIAFLFAMTIERRRTEEELKESEARFRNLFNGSRDALMILEPPLWLFTSCNQATLDMFKAGNEAKFISYEPWKLSPERQPDGRSSEEKAKEMIETAMREGSCFFEWRHRRMNGEEFRQRYCCRGWNKIKRFFCRQPSEISPKLSARKNSLKNACMSLRFFIKPRLTGKKEYWN